MTHEQKINYMRIASGIAGFGINTHQLDLLISIYELILEKKGKSNVEDAVKIEYEVKQREKERQIKEMIDKKIKEKEK